MRALLLHELRWARTIRALVPVAFASSCLQYPIAWAALALGLSGGAGWAAALFAGCWGVRAAAARGIDRSLAPHLGPHPERLAFAAPVWLLPLRDLTSIGVMVASYLGRRVAWRGQTLHADNGLRETFALAAPRRRTVAS